MSTLLARTRVNISSDGTHMDTKEEYWVETKDGVDVTFLNDLETDW